MYPVSGARDSMSTSCRASCFRLKDEEGKLVSVNHRLGYLLFPKYVSNHRGNVTKIEVSVSVDGA